MSKLPQVISLACILLAVAPWAALADSGAEFDAEPAQRFYYRVLVEGETDQLTIEVENTGRATWALEDDVQLRSAPFFKGVSDTVYLPLDRSVAPGDMATWSLPLDETGSLYQRLQMVREELPFGSDFAMVVIILPEGVAEKRDELEQSIQEIIEEWVARGEDELDMVVEEIKKLAEESLRDLWGRLVETVKGWAQDTADNACNSLCGGAALIAVSAAVAIGRRRR